MIFNAPQWFQIVMNGAVMPALVLLLFKTLQDSHKKEIESHKEDKALLQQQLKVQGDALGKMCNTLERIDLRLERVENIVERKEA